MTKRPDEPVTPAPNYTWDDLRSRIGEPSAADDSAFSIAAPASVLIQMGRRIRSERILTDLLRWIGVAHDFWHSASIDQTGEIVGFAPGLLKVALRDALVLRDLVERDRQHQDSQGVAQSGVEATAQSLRDRALARRDQFFAALAASAVNERELIPQIEAAYGTAGDHRQIADSLAALANLGISIVTQGKKSPAAIRLAAAGITADSFKPLLTLASELKSAGDKAAGATAEGPVRQSELDLRDGICLTHMTALRSMFDAAHIANPAIPRLIPISTRHFFGPSYRAKPGLKAPASGSPQQSP